EAQAIVLAPGEEKRSIDFFVPANAPTTLEALAGAATSGRAAAANNGVIRGEITRADGRSLQHAVVRLSRDNNAGPPPTTVTDDQGRYEFLRVPAGSYTVIASKSGFITVQYGQRRTVDPGEPIELKPDETRDRIDISLPQPGAISGRVSDEEGDPVEGANVRVLQIKYDAGRRRLFDATGNG